MFWTPLCLSSGASLYCTCSLWSPCGVVSVASSSPVTTELGWRTQPKLHHTVTRGCMCSGGKLLMMDTVVSETCWATQSEIKFYDFKTDVHLVGFYSILSLVRDLIQEAGRVPRPQTARWKRQVPSTSQIRLDSRHNRRWLMHCKRIRYHLCSAWNKETRTTYKCWECNIGLCATPCFKVLLHQIAFLRTSWH
jgi:hypothetical protein